MEHFINNSHLFDGSKAKYVTNGRKTMNYPLISIFFNCSDLIFLDLAHNNIHKTYDDWFLLSKLNLTVLDLSHNSISELNVSYLNYYLT